MNFESAWPVLIEIEVSFENQRASTKAYYIFMIKFVEMVLSNQDDWCSALVEREKRKIFFLPPNTLHHEIKWFSNCLSTRPMKYIHTQIHFDNAVKINALNWMEDTNAICIRTNFYFIRYATNNTQTCTHARTNTYTLLLHDVLNIHKHTQKSRRFIRQQ